MRRDVVLAPLDAELLDRLSRDPSLERASRSLGISGDRGRYRLQRLARAVGTAVVVGERGGRDRGRTELTAAGRTLLEAGPGAVVGPAPPRSTERRVASGLYTSGRVPSVALPGGPTLAVAFTARSGERVAIEVDPSAILLADRRFPTSARNVLAGVVERVRRSRSGAPWRVVVRVGSWRVPVSVTAEAVRSLRLVPGRRTYLYVKATAVRRAGRPLTRGSPRR